MLKNSISAEGNEDVQGRAVNWLRHSKCRPPAVMKRCFYMLKTFGMVSIKGMISVADEMGTLLTLDELRKRLKLSKETISWLKDSGIPRFKVGRSIRFDLNELDNGVAKMKSKNLYIPPELVANLKYLHPEDPSHLPCKGETAPTSEPLMSLAHSQRYIEASWDLPKKLWSQPNWKATIFLLTSFEALWVKARPHILNAAKGRRPDPAAPSGIRYAADKLEAEVESDQHVWLVRLSAALLCDDQTSFSVTALWTHLDFLSFSLAAEAIRFRSIKVGDVQRLLDHYK